MLEATSDIKPEVGSILCYWKTQAKTKNDKSRFIQPNVTFFLALSLQLVHKRSFMSISNGTGLEHQQSNINLKHCKTQLHTNVQSIVGENANFTLEFSVIPTTVSMGLGLGGGGERAVTSKKGTTAIEGNALHDPMLQILLYHLWEVSL